MLWSAPWCFFTAWKCSLGKVWLWYPVRTELRFWRDISLRISQMWYFASLILSWTIYCFLKINPPFVAGKAFLFLQVWLSMYQWLVLLPLKAKLYLPVTAEDASGLLDYDLNPCEAIIDIISIKTKAINFWLFWNMHGFSIWFLSKGFFLVQTESKRTPLVLRCEILMWIHLQSTHNTGTPHYIVWWCVIWWWRSITMAPTSTRHNKHSENSFQMT